MIPPSASVTPASFLSRIKRRVGKPLPTQSDADRIKDAVIEELDLAGAERWIISAVTGLSERQVYRRLDRIRSERRDRRIAEADDARALLGTPAYGV